MRVEIALPYLLVLDSDRQLDPSFGWYFAGLIDGEGCFSIAPNRCEFTLKMREDDRPLIEWTREMCGDIGTLTTERGLTPDQTRRPQTRWRVSRQRQLVWLTELFDAYPLRSKKANDYAVWREAVIAWATGMSPTGLAEYKQRLSETRAYVASIGSGLSMEEGKDGLG